MRDLVILVALVAVMFWSIRSAWIGVMAWTIVSLMSPHGEFGYAAGTWPVATGIAACTLIGLLISKERQNPLLGAPPVWLLAFTVWICITLPFSMVFDEAYTLWTRSMKIYLMLFVTLALVDNRKKLQAFIWMNVIGIGYYGVKGGAFTIVTGGNYRVWGTGGFIEGNNEVALAVITVIPLMRYLQLQTGNRIVKLGLTGAIGLSVVMALGTYSRGALVGMAAMMTLFWWKGRNKLLWGVLIVAGGLVGLSLMPEQWWDRMDTIKSYESDGSAMGRINAWWMAFNLAKDNLLGGGFMVYTLPIFQRYAPIPDDVHAAHSIYFQILGEHGFIGLFLFLGIGASTWLSARRLIKAGRESPEFRWASDLGSMIHVSMVGYGITGAFLSLAYFDLPYNVMVMATVAAHLVRQQQRQTAAVPVPAASGPSTPAPPAAATGVGRLDARRNP